MPRSLTGLLTGLLPGIILVTAALLKASDRDPVGTGFPESHSGRLLLIAFELVLGIATWFGPYRAVATAGTLVTFAAYTVVSTTRAVQGQVACDCLGSLKVSPVAAAAVAFAGMTLAAWQLIVRTGWRPAIAQAWNLAPATAVVAVILGAGAGVAYGRYDSPDAALCALRGEELRTARTVHLGTVPSGSRQEVRLSVTNVTGSELAIIGSASDCVCFAAERAEVRIPPYSTAEYVMLLNVASDSKGPFRRETKLFTTSVRQMAIPVVLHGRIE